MTINRKLSGTTLALAVAVALAAPAAVQAQDYQFEGGLSYLHVSPDFGSSDSALGADVAWYLQPVQTGNLPLAAAAFYNRASNLNASYVTFDDLDLNLLTLGGEFYFDRFFLGADYLRYSNGGSSNDFEFAAGYVPVDGLRLAVRYLSADLGDDAWAFDVKYVAPLAGGTAVGLDASLELVDDSIDTTVLAVGGDYYFNPAFSLGARLVYTDTDFGSDTGWGLGARYFFTPMFSGEVEYLTSDDVDVLAVRFAARF